MSPKSGWFKKSHLFLFFDLNYFAFDNKKAIKTMLVVCVGVLGIDVAVRVKEES